MQEITVRGREIEVGDSVRVLHQFRGLIATTDYSERYREMVTRSGTKTDQATLAYADAGARIGRFSDGTVMTIEGLGQYVVLRDVP